MDMFVNMDNDTAHFNVYQSGADHRMLQRSIQFWTLPVEQSPDA